MVTSELCTGEVNDFVFTRQTKRRVVVAKTRNFFYWGDHRPSAMLDKFDSDDLGAAAYSQRRAPCACACRSVHLHFAQALQSVNNLAVHSFGGKCPWPELAMMRVTRK